MEPLRRERLANGLILDFHDLSNRYFGDYHRLHLEVRCRIPLDESLPSVSEQPDEVLARARNAFGSHVEFRRELTRMGVAGDDVEQVRARMIDDFMASSGSYLSSSAFPGQFVRRKVEETGKERRFVPKIL